MSTIRPVFGAMLLAPCLCLLPTQPVARAAQAESPSPILALVHTLPVGHVPVADSVSWRGFVKYWKGFIHSADRVILVVALVAAAALFIITRGRWLR